MRPAMACAMTVRHSPRASGGGSSRRISFIWICEHALLNLLGLVMMWALFARDYRPGQWLLIVVVIVLAIDAGLWFWDTDLHWYVGASGALHGFMAAGTLAHLRRGDLDGWILAIFIVRETRI